MQNFRELKMQVTRRLKQDLIRANNYFQKSFHAPEVSYTVRGLKAGVAYLTRNEIRFNPILLQENGADFINQVVPHELAHILVYQHFGQVSPHGKEWKMMMEQVLGVKAETYHCFDTSNVAKQFAYRCACQQHWLSVRRHNAMQRGKRHYLCKKCQTALFFEGDAEC